jgi:hypothetical protein
MKQRSPWSIYDAETGLFIGRTVGADNIVTVELNTPAGCKAMPGLFDPETQRVDLETGTVVEWVAPATPPTPAEQVAMAAQRLASIDRQSQRALRELAINPDDSTARARIVALEQEAEPFRQIIRGNHGSAPTTIA